MSIALVSGEGSTYGWSVLCAAPCAATRLARWRRQSVEECDRSTRCSRFHARVARFAAARSPGNRQAVVQEHVVACPAQRLVQRLRRGVGPGRCQVHPHRPGQACVRSGRFQQARGLRPGAVALVRRTGRRAPGWVRRRPSRSSDTADRSRSARRHRSATRTVDSLRCRRAARKSRASPRSAGCR